jgi:hypothetical protein
MALMDVCLAVKTKQWMKLARTALQIAVGSNVRSKGDLPGPPISQPLNIT